MLANFRLSWILLLAAVTPAGAQKQGADLLKTDVLGVFAHPDDETGMASTIAKYALGEGKVVAHAYCTRGEGGGNMVGRHWGAALGVLREAELRDCLAGLGVRSHFFLDQLDWAYTESAAMTLQKWDKEEALGRLVRYVRALRPEIILTMNPFPRPGQHGHHQAAGMLAVEAFTAAADPARYPEQIQREGLSVWQPRKLYFRGSSAGPVAKIDGGVTLPNGKTAHEVAGAALSNHRSQGFGNFRRANALRPPEEFGLIKSVVAPMAEERDLFVGLPVAAEDPKPLPPPATPEPEWTMTFDPRPAVANFRVWATKQGIAHLVGAIPTDLPVVAGQENEVTLRLAKKNARTVVAKVRLQPAEGWTVEPASIDLDWPSNEPTRLARLRVRPPAVAKQDSALKAVAEGLGQPLEASMTLHPVPSLRAARLASPPKMDGTDAGWADAPFHEIAPTDLAEGKTENAADSSARFRVARDGERIYVDVLVRDQAIVSNIAPDDIRGHWRSDSLEFCFDPAGGSEHTLNCYKLGVFPFDTTGAARGARDADAKQGPMEETAPGTRLVSAKTADGYRVQLSVPLAEIGATAPLAKPLGFNLIVYDGDKAGAALGENINESRLAWSPRPGVQGRPEDWGRILP